MRAVIEQVFTTERKRPVSGEALVRIIRSVDIYVCDANIFSFIIIHFPTADLIIRH